MCHSGYGIWVYSCLEFSLPDSRMGEIVIIFGVAISSSVHSDNKGKDTLIFGEGPPQGLDATTLRAEAKYPINFTQPNQVKDLH